LAQGLLLSPLGEQMKLVGMVLVILGIVGLVWGGSSWTERETVVDIGPVEVERENRESIPLSPIAGGVLLVAGIVVLVSSRR
jgi:hypothetical protein